MKLTNLPYFLTSAALFSLVTTTADAVIVLGVTGDGNLGTLTANSFYEIETSTGATTYTGNTSGVIPNQLAFDVTTGSYYYMDHTGSNFYRYQTGTQTLIGDLTNFGMPVGKIGSGGGDFYNGVYYYSPEEGSEIIYAVKFSPDGNSIQSHIPLTTSNLSDFSDTFDGSAYAGLGNFGDFAIDSGTGILYGSSILDNASQGGTYNAFWSIDLTSANKTMSMLNDSIGDVYQLAFDVNNDLWGNLWGSSELVQINKVTGEVIGGSTVSISGNGDFFDLASAGVRTGPEVPEPASIALLIGMMALASTVTRRRRREV